MKVKRTRKKNPSNFFDSRVKLWNVLWRKMFRRFLFFRNYYIFFCFFFVCYQVFSCRTSDLTVKLTITNHSKIRLKEHSLRWNIFNRNSNSERLSWRDSRSSYQFYKEICFHSIYRQRSKQLELSNSMLNMMRVMMIRRFAGV